MKRLVFGEDKILIEYMDGSIKVYEPSDSGVTLYDLLFYPTPDEEQK